VGQNLDGAAAILTLPAPDALTPAHLSSYLGLGTGAGQQPEGAIWAEWAHLETVCAVAQLLPVGHEGGVRSGGDWRGLGRAALTSQSVPSLLPLPTTAVPILAHL
jgi:hypothetical protein